MNHDMQEALQALALGMGTVFCGLLMLLAAMKTVGWTLARRPRKVVDAENVSQEDPEDLVMSADLVAAIAAALHMDQLAMEEMEAQRLTWTRMFKPFSPWLMDSKNTLHTHRLRWHAVGAPGRIVSERQRG
jgi:Na+-transporting methylmalonyl-CoA/oxaloacetate decarboxylase gamma subunit